MNTALGNCCLMIAAVLGFALKFNIRFEILDDGDDCLLIISKTDLALVLHEITPFFLSLGHELKVDGYTNNISKVVWCQSNPIQTKRCWKFVRHPRKVMSCALVGIRWRGVPPKIRREYLAGLAECELALHFGVPILQSFAQALARNSQGAKARFDDSDTERIRATRELKMLQKFGSHLDLEISADARLSFSDAFGITVDEQYSIESQLDAWNFECSGDIEEAFNWNPISWTLDRPKHEFQ
jgi:hypothetical protein